MKWFKRKCCGVSLEGKTSTTCLRVGLIGNPNCGKTTVFNAITGGCQQVGNWPGVTVERKTGCITVDETTIELIDLPGVYSLTGGTHAAIDEQITCEFMLGHQADVVLNIIDASNLERHLYLTLQLIEMGIPVLIGLNMMDVAHHRGLQINTEKLAKELGCKVIPIIARNGEGIELLKQALVTDKRETTSHVPYPPLIMKASDALSKACNIKTEGPYLGIRLLEDALIQSPISADVLSQVKDWQYQITQTQGEDADIMIADARYRFVQTLFDKCVIKMSKPVTAWTARIDSLMLNRFWGIPLFLAIMYALFFFAINVGGAFQDFFDISSNTIFVDGLSYGLKGLGAPNGLIALLANGVGKGINTILTFIPVIGAMFLGLAFLEDSGYMARAAFIIDRLMRALGLPGKSFVPMIVGFGCNVPAVMAARTLENPRDRILTVMMTPFMSCSARLAIFAVFTTAFFPTGGQNIVFILYFCGILMAVLTGWLLRKTVLKGDPAPLVMELPPYHWPTLRILSRHAWQRLSGFVWRAGKLILPICILLGVFNALNTDGSLNSGNGDSHSILAAMGQWLTPLFEPMGIHADNWPATVGLVTGVLAKEVVVGTLNSLYGQIDQLTTAFSFWDGLKDAFESIPTNLSQLGSALVNPILAKAPVHTLNQSVYGAMVQQFDGTIGAMAYLLFVLLYFPCVSTIGAMARELSRAWACFSVLWTTGLAYGVAVAFYQIATFIQHPVFSSMWLGSLGFMMLVMIISLRVYGSHEFTRT